MRNTYSDEVEVETLDGTNDFVPDAEVQQEFENAEDRGESALEQLTTELEEEHYILPSALVSREDSVFSNISPDQQGESFGLAYQPNEPLDSVEKIEDRDESRWEMNPASADDFEETTADVEGQKK